jgi:vacuolar-type H+-ATPase subunit I/STV1
MSTALRIEPYTGTAKAGVASEKEIEDIGRELSALEQRYSAVTLRSKSPVAAGAITTESIEDPATNQGVVELSNEYRRRLLLWRQRLENTRTIEEAKSRCARTRKTLVIEGWIPRGRVKDFERAVNDGAEGYCVISYTPPYAEREAHSQETRSLPPTKIKNPRIAYVYEKLVTGFGLPNYFEVDPTVFMIVSFPVIFGLMFGDIGHGLILLGLSLLLVAVNRSGFRAPELFEYLIRGSPLLVMCSIAAVFFGFLYGEVFGSGEYYHVIESTLHGFLGFKIHEAVRSASHSLEVVLSSVAGFPVIIPFPFEPFEKPMLLLLVALYVAIIQITLGLILGLVNQLRRGKLCRGHHRSGSMAVVLFELRLLIPEVQVSAPLGCLSTC